MKKIENGQNTEIPPVTIEFTGLEAVAITDFLGVFTLDQIKDIMSRTSITKSSPELIDKVTDDLFEVLVDHVKA